MFSVDLLIGKRPFGDKTMPGKSIPFQTDCQQVPKNHYSSADIKGLTTSKINVLHHLAMQSGSLVILLQKTHCTDAEKLVLSNCQLAGSSLSRKHGLATFVHEQLSSRFWTNLHQHRRSSGCVWTLMAIK